jgi:hypothetical protein
MRRNTFVAAFGFMLLISPLTSFAQTGSQEEWHSAVARGSEWLRSDMQKWRNEHQCGACHHAPLALYSLNASVPVNDSFLKELTEWVSTDEARLIPPNRSTGDSAATLSLPAVYLSVGLSALPRDDENLFMVKQRLLQHLRETQQVDGSWVGPSGRVPVFASPQEVTLLVLVAWDAQRDLFPDSAPMLDKAAAWVQAQSPSESHQELSLRVLWLASRGQAERAASFVERLWKSQQPDGGWKQAVGEPSDAFATGQALVALHRTGLASDNPALQRGRRFLLQSQQPDGSWPMTSRPHPENHSRAMKLNPITYAGTAWAVTALNQLKE